MTALVVILAAGAGSRLGGVAKALLRVGDDSYLEQIARTARAAGVSRGLVVVGAPHAAEVAAAARALGLEVATNGDPARGMASSVACGFSAATGRVAFTDVDVALLWPVDHPHVQVATIERVVAALAADRDVAAAIPTHGGHGGHPPAIRRAAWLELATCGGHPDGAAGVLRAMSTARVEVDDAGVLRDVDVPADLEAPR